MKLLNPLTFILLFSVLFVAVFAAIGTETGYNIQITSRSVTDVDPDIPGDQPGKVITFAVMGDNAAELDPDSLLDSIYVGDVDNSVKVKDSPLFRKFEKVADYTYELWLGDSARPADPDDPEEEEPEAPVSNPSPTPKNSAAQAQQAAPKSSTGDTQAQQQAAAGGSTGNTQGSTGNTSPAAGGSTGNTDAPEGPTGNTQAQQAAPEGSTGNTSPGGSTGNTQAQQAAPGGPTGNTQGTPPSSTTNTPAEGTTAPVDLSDLVASIPVVSKTVLDSGESFTMSVAVENIGESLSPEAILRYYRSSAVGVSGTEVGQKSVSPIAAMGTSDVSIELTAPDTPGTYLYYACVSSVTGVSNTGSTCTPNSVELTVRGEPQDPSEPATDTKQKQPSEPVNPSGLGVSIPVISKTVLDSGESFTMSVTVENTGGSLSPETTLKYYRSSGVGESGTEVGQKSVSPIAAMGTSDVSIELSAPDAPGTYLYYACISSVTGEGNTGSTCTPNSVELKVRGEPQDTPGAPLVVGRQFTAAQIDDLEAQIELLAAKNDRSPAARQTLAYLRSLIAMARPEKTQLLANYPNPFNPETWIPYRLASAANVTVTIYDINGQVVRRLALGHQAAGIYQSRSRAAYWDGRNALGEPVASGLYFYTLTAGDFTATRKMLIRK